MSKFMFRPGFLEAILATENTSGKTQLSARGTLERRL